MKNVSLRVYNPVVRACIGYQIPELSEPKASYVQQQPAKSGGKNRSQRVYNPTVSGYGGYVQHESRELKTVSEKRKRRSGEVKEAKRLVGELVSSLASGRKPKAANIREVKHNPVLKKNRKLMGKVRRGLENEDVRYLKNLARSM